MLRKLITFRGPYKILNLAWMAFFLTFVVWFSYAPFATTIAKDMSLSPAQSKTITLCNLALTIPARIIMGMVLDRFGPRITYSGKFWLLWVQCCVAHCGREYGVLECRSGQLAIEGGGIDCVRCDVRNMGLIWHSIFRAVLPILESESGGCVRKEAL